MEQRRHRHRSRPKKRRGNLLRIVKVSVVILLTVLFSVVMFYSGRYGILEGLGGSSEQQE